MGAIVGCTGQSVGDSVVLYRSEEKGAGREEREGQAAAAASAAATGASGSGLGGGSGDQCEETGRDGGRWGRREAGKEGREDVTVFGADGGGRG